MKYLITGGAGFIGSHMVRFLLRNPANSVRVFDNFITGRREFLKPHAQDARLKIIEGDLLNLDQIKRAIEGCEFVFHFAANADIAKSVEETDLDLKQTVIATYNLLEAMRLCGVAKIAYSSGSGVYGDVGLTETAETYGPLLPISMYGASKLGAEAQISAFCHLYEMQAWIYRFANVVGPRQTHGVGYDFIRKLRANPHELSILGDGEQSKSYIHVEDIISAMTFTISVVSDRTSIFNVATGDYITVKEIAAIVMDEMALRNVALNYTGGNRGWKGDVPLVRFDTRKINAIGWSPKFGSAQAIRRSVQSMLQE